MTSPIFRFFYLFCSCFLCRPGYGTYHRVGTGCRTRPAGRHTPGSKGSPADRPSCRKSFRRNWSDFRTAALHCCTNKHPGSQGSNPAGPRWGRLPHTKTRRSARFGRLSFSQKLFRWSKNTFSCLYIVWTKFFVCLAKKCYYVLFIFCQIMVVKSWSEMRKCFFLKSWFTQNGLYVNTSP